MSDTVKDYKKSDQCAAASLLNALISWVNEDHEDTLTISHNQGCYIRDEIGRLRKAEQENVALRAEKVEWEKRENELCSAGVAAWAENEALEAKLAKLEAPVSGEEWPKTWDGYPRPSITRSACNALIAARGREGE